MLLIVLGKFARENLESVADDRVVQGPLGDDRWVELHARAAQRKIDGGLPHARQVLEGALVAVGAGRAVHAADIEAGDAGSSRREARIKGRERRHDVSLCSE